MGGIRTRSTFKRNRPCPQSLRSALPGRMAVRTALCITTGRRGRMNILVTGGAGYIGSQLLHTLADQFPGARRIRVLDNMREEKFPSLMNLPGNVDYEFVLGDIREEDDIRRALGDDTDAVVHLAALCNANLSFERRNDTEEINYRGTLKVVDVA